MYKLFILTAHCHSSCDVPWWPTTNVPRVVSCPWSNSLMKPDNFTTRSSCPVLVLYWRRQRGRDVTSRRCDVSDSFGARNLSVVDSVSHFVYFEWSSVDTRQIQSQSATYSWRSWRQATMSLGFLIPLTWMPSPSGRSVSAVYVLILEEFSQTAYSMLSICATPITLPTT